MQNYNNINIGCGDRLTKGYLNFDCSLSVRVAKLPNVIIMRVLKPGGGVRIIVPNLRMKIDDYIKNNDGDNFFFNLGFYMNIT